ncbi:unnamed protein product [Mytilus edulis]|uniref:Uncharacterized protein n=1 Tax=Mytilus edulis TaxID=6550 RepID=A0A8S3TSF5_MYTED|nr:unnamed protein product [Mytilus edulis]
MVNILSSINEWSIYCLQPTDGHYTCYTVFSKLMNAKEEERKKKKPLSAVDPIMEDISFLVSNQTDDAMDDPCLNQDTSMLKIEPCEDISCLVSNQTDDAMDDPCLNQDTSMLKIEPCEDISCLVSNQTDDAMDDPCLNQDTSMLKIEPCEDISFLVSNQTDDAMDDPCLNQDISMLKIESCEDISITSAEHQRELLLVEHEDHNYAAKEKPLDRDYTYNQEFDCREDFFLAPVEGTQEIEIFSVYESPKELAESSLSPFKTLCCLLQIRISDPYIFKCTENEIRIVELYQISSKNLSIKLTVNIDSSFCANIYVHRKEVSRDNAIWMGLPNIYDSVESVTKLLSRLSCFSVCVGNPDEKYQYITPVGCGISPQYSSTIRSFREGNFSATSAGSGEYTSTIRSVHCSLLVKRNRCSQCANDRKMLRKRHQRAVERQNSPLTDFVHKSIKHESMTRSNLIEKINQQRDEIQSMSLEIKELKRKFQKEVLKNDAS